MFLCVVAVHLRGLVFQDGSLSKIQNWRGVEQAQRPQHSGAVAGINVDHLGHRARPRAAGADGCEAGTGQSTQARAALGHGLRRGHDLVLVDDRHSGCTRPCLGARASRRCSRQLVGSVGRRSDPLAEPCPASLEGSAAHQVHSARPLAHKVDGEQSVQGWRGGGRLQPMPGCMPAAQHSQRDDQRRRGSVHHGRRTGAQVCREHEAVQPSGDEDAEKCRCVGWKKSPHNGQEKSGLNATLATSSIEKKKGPVLLRGLVFFGGSCEIRTRDQRIKSQTLSSYKSIGYVIFWENS